MVSTLPEGIISYNHKEICPCRRSDQVRNPACGTTCYPIIKALAKYKLVISLGNIKLVTNRANVTQGEIRL